MLAERIHQLDFTVNADGSIDLEQPSGFGEVDRITLHSAHVRLLFERATHLLPPPPADELSRRLAGKLCEVLDELCGERGRSHVIDRVIDRLSAAVEMLPDCLFQSDDKKPATSEQSVFELTHPPKEYKPCSTHPIKR